MRLLGLIIPLEGAEGGEHWPPGVHSFDPRPLFPGAGIDWVSNNLFQAVLGAVLVIAVWIWLANGHQVVPTRKQFVGEQVYNLLRNSIARDILGHDYRKYLPYLVAMFSFILVNNLFGQFFLFMFPTFSRVGYAYALAIMTFLLYNGAGIAKYGLVDYLKRMTIPPGVPVALWPIIIPLEFASNFIVRPITLALRLFANLFAGHLVVLVFVMGGTLLVQQANAIYIIAGGAAFVMSFAIFALEIFVACLQAYIFTVLTAQYVASAIAEEH